MSVESSTNVKAVKQYLLDGGSLTSDQARTQFGIRSMTAVARSLWNDGYAVYINRIATTPGKRIRVNRVGVPTPAVIDAGYKALGMAPSRTIVSAGYRALGLTKARRRVVSHK